GKQPRLGAIVRERLGDVVLGRSIVDRKGRRIGAVSVADRDGAGGGERGLCVGAAVVRGGVAEGLRRGGEVGIGRAGIVGGACTRTRRWRLRLEGRVTDLDLPRDQFGGEQPVGDGAVGQFHPALVEVLHEALAALGLLVRLLLSVFRRRERAPEVGRDG